MLKCVHRKYTVETFFKLLEIVLCHVYGTIDDIFSLIFSKFSKMGRYIFYNHGVIEKRIRKKKKKQRGDLIDLLFLYNQENLHRELLGMVSRESPLDANSRL